MTYVDPLTAECWVCDAPAESPCVYKHGDRAGQPLPSGNAHPPRHTAADHRLTDRDLLLFAVHRLVERLDSDNYGPADLDLARRLGAWALSKGVS